MKVLRMIVIPREVPATLAVIPGGMFGGTAFNDDPYGDSSLAQGVLTVKTPPGVVHYARSGHLDPTSLLPEA